MTGLRSVRMMVKMSAGIGLDSISRRERRRAALSGRAKLSGVASLRKLVKRMGAKPAKKAVIRLILLFFVKLWAIR